MGEIVPNFQGNNDKFNSSIQLLYLILRNCCIQFPRPCLHAARNVDDVLKPLRLQE